MSDCHGRAGAAPPINRALLVACLALAINLAASPETQADPRFGDSTWIAPAMPEDGDSASTGPRVAPPDHERVWETVLRTPFRIVFFPFRLMARGVEAGVNHFAPRYLDPKPKEPNPGLKLRVRVDLSDATTGVEDVGIGPAVSWDGFPTADSQTKASASFSLKDRRRAKLRTLIKDNRPISFQFDVDYDFKPNRSYFGIGNDTQKDDRGYYRLEQTKVEAALRLGTSPLRRLRLLAGYSGMSPGVGEHASPLVGDFYPPGSVPYEGTATHYFVSGVTGDLAALDDSIHPSLGVHGRAEFRHASGLRDVDPDFNQWLVEGRAYLPVFAKRRVLTFRGAYTGVDPIDDAAVMPFYRLAQSEGSFRFIGYSTQRFRDRELMLGHIEYRWMISHKVSAFALYQAGAVAPHSSAFSLRNTHVTWGGGLRLGRNDASAIRLDVGSSVEGIHALLRLRSDF